MADIKTIFEELDSTRARNEKQAILEKNIENEDLVNAFYFAYNPYINFFTKKLPKIDEADHLGTLAFGDALKLLEPIYTKELRGSHARTALIKDILTQLSFRDADILRRVIAKNLKCGCSRGSFNKVKNIIPKFSVLLAKEYDATTAAGLNAPYVVQLKSDGSRASTLVTSDSIRFFSREGNELLVDAPQIKEHLTNLRNHHGYDFMIDGELVLIDDDGVCDRQKSNGIINKAIAGTISTKEDSQLSYYVWDVVPMDNFNSGMDKTPYIERLKRLDTLLNFTITDHHLEVSPTDIVETIAEIDEIILKYIDAGEEGAVVKSHDLVWQDKRSAHMLKAKDINECDLIAKSWNPRDENVARNEGIGSINFESSDGIVKVAVSSGLSYEMCGYVKDEKGNYVFDPTFDCDKYNECIGKIVYNKKIPNKDGNGFTLFSPRIILFRSDKTEADSNSRIK